MLEISYTSSELYTIFINLNLFPQFPLIVITYALRPSYVIMYLTI